MPSFNKNLRALRLQASLTQQQVADALGITKGTYSGYETGRREPDVPKIKALAELFKVSGDQLLGLEVSLKDESPTGVKPPAGEQIEDIKEYVGNLLTTLGIASADHPISDADQQLISGILDIIEAYRRKESSKD